MLVQLGLGSCTVFASLDFIYYCTSLTEKHGSVVPEASPLQTLHLFHLCSLSAAPSLGQQEALPSAEHSFSPDKHAILAKVFAPRQEVSADWL